MPLLRERLAVPPVDRIVTPRRVSACANSTRPSLLETLSSARRTAMGEDDCLSCAETVDLQLLAQRAAIDAEDVGRAALVALGIVEHGLEQRLFDFAQHQVIELAGLVAVQAREIGIERLCRHRPQRHAPAARACERLSPSSGFFSRRHGLSAKSSIYSHPRRDRHAPAAFEPRSTEFPRFASASKYACARRVVSARLSPASRLDVKPALRRDSSHTSRCACARS